MAAKSHLTRAVFRSILTSRPFVPRDCRRHLLQRDIGKYGVRSAILVQRRSLFGMSFSGNTRPLQGSKSTPGNLELALGQMVDLMRARRTQSRPPLENQVLDAFKYVFRSHLESPSRFSRNEIFLTTETFKHLQELQQRQEEGNTPLLSEEDMRIALQSLATASGRERFRSDKQALAYMIFQELRSRSENSTFENDPELLKTLISILSRSGGTKEALELLRKSSLAHEQNSMSSWIAIIKGLASEGYLKDSRQVFEEMCRTVGSLDAETHEDLTTYFADTDNVNDTKFFFEQAESFEPTQRCKTAVARMCIRKKEIDFGNHVIQSLKRDHEPEAEQLDLLWQAVQNVPVETIMKSLGHEPTIHHLNGLMHHAYSNGDSAKAMEYLNFARAQKIRPDAETYLLQMKHQLDIGNLSAATELFNILVAEDTLPDHSDVPILNKLLAILCFSDKPDFEMVMRVVDRVIDRPIDLDAEALAGLCHVFLQRDELQDATGVLRHRVDSYPSADRARVSAVFRQFICDPAVEDFRAWNVYELFRRAFPETPVQQRLPLMNSFFDRKRSDLACMVFGHMRQREDIEARPTAEAYAQCFEGISRCRDVDGLQIVYNMLKLDLEIEPTTRIHNGLIRAYTACDLPFTAIVDHFWKIMESREGPTMSSFALALRACETWVPQGSQEARRIIAMMQGMGLYINRDIYHCYIGALAGQSEFENTIELIERMEEDIDEKPDAVTIGTFYNAIPWQYRKNEVEAWAKKAYPELWEELLTYGETIDEEWEVRYFNIDRNIDIDDEPLFGDGTYDPEIAQTSQAYLEAGPV